MPPKSNYQRYIDQIWDSGQLTNGGPLLNKLEAALEDYLKVEHLQFVANGTVALRLALKSLQLKGEVITTPFSYVATTSAILWEQLDPVFVDINSSGFCINADLIEASITPKTTAILATHVYGLPCDVDKIETIAKKYNLKVIYDAAHAFGVKLNGTSLYNYGDISTTSFHATKIFHTIEGGAVITKNAELSEHIALLKAFGHRSDNHFHPGINGKNSEFHAAMGLCNLDFIDELIDRRKQKFELYKQLLRPLPVKTLEIPTNVEYNYAYFPVIFRDSQEMFAVKKALEKNAIYPRRYFYPSLNKLSYIQNGPCPESENLSMRVLCLPFYPELEDDNIAKISSILETAIYEYVV